jgi:hypothetical protein
MIVCTQRLGVTVRPAHLRSRKSVGTTLAPYGASIAAYRVEVLSATSDFGNLNNAISFIKEYPHDHYPRRFVPHN